MDLGRSRDLGLDEAAMAAAKSTLIEGCALRLRETATERFWFNYTAETQIYDGKTFAPASVLRERLEATPNQ